MMDQYQQALIQALMNQNGGQQPSQDQIQNASNPMMQQFAGSPPDLNQSPLNPPQTNPWSNQQPFNPSPWSPGSEFGNVPQSFMPSSQQKSPAFGQEFMSGGISKGFMPSGY